MDAFQVEAGMPVTWLLISDKSYGCHPKQINTFNVINNNDNFFV